MAQLQGKSGGDDMTGRVGELPMQGSVDMVVALTGRTDKNTPLAGTFGVGFYIPNWILLEDNTVMMMENGTNRIFEE
jgi:HSP90 family molecular chaperone